MRTLTVKYPDGDRHISHFEKLVVTINEEKKFLDVKIIEPDLQVTNSEKSVILNLAFSTLDGLRIAATNLVSSINLIEENITIFVD